MGRHKVGTMTYRFGERAKAMYTRLMTRFSQETTVGILKQRGITMDRVNQDATTAITNTNLNGIIVRYDQEEITNDMSKTDDIKFITDSTVEINKAEGDFITISSVDYRIVNVHRVEWNGILVAQEVRLAK